MFFNIKSKYRQYVDTNLLYMSFEQSAAMCVTTLSYIASFLQLLYVIQRCSFLDYPTNIESFFKNN